MPTASYQRSGKARADDETREDMSEVKERPILFSAPMIRALIDGSKTQTRRIMKPQPVKPSVNESDECPSRWYENGELNGVPSNVWSCPYGKPGDRLWVRETWASAYQDGCWGTAFFADGAFVQGKQQHPKGPHFHAKELGEHVRWKPSIHMPRWASRITLEITEVRVQRLQEISEEDARAEGSYLGRCDCAVMQRRETTPLGISFHQTGCHIHGEEFKYLWNCIHGEGSWAKNSWVWAVSFKVVK